MNRRLDAVDPLRGLAILLVFIYHAGPLVWRLAPYRSDGFLAWPPARGLAWLGVPLLHFGFSGVHAFFVLSGVCIHLRAARDRDAPMRWKNYFLRRFFRIYPPYWIALALFGVVLPRVLPRAVQTAPLPTLGDVALHGAMLHTFFSRTIFSINPAFWSLATEEQFYLAYPLVLIAARRIGMRRVVALAFVLSLAWRGAVLLSVAPTVENFLIYRVLLHALFVPRWFEWLLGAWLAELAVSGDALAKHRRTLLGLAPLLLALAMLCRVHITIDKLLSDAFFASGYAALTGALLVRTPSHALARAFGALGRRAYGIYLIHQPLLDLAAFSLVARAAIAATCGVLFSAWCERPFERRAARVGRSSSDLVERASG